MPINKGEELDFQKKYQKLQPHWDRFKKYVEKVTRNKEIVSRKVNFHKLGQGGYKSAIILKWERQH